MHDIPPTDAPSDEPRRVLSFTEECGVRRYVSSQASRSGTVASRGDAVTASIRKWAHRWVHSSFPCGEGGSPENRNGVAGKSSVSTIIRLLRFHAVACVCALPGASMLSWL